jgi:DNA polymerase-4
MDAFFASVEQHDDPSIAGKPVLVGGRSRRGVVAAASYEARPFGVHSAMPMVEALRRCPNAIVVEPHHSRYSEVSEQVFAVFHRYTPLVEGLSVDEAFLDVTASRALFGEAAEIAARIKQDIRRETGLTASAGVAPCKFVAKVASDHGKPDGLVVVEPDEVESFLSPLPIERMWGVGEVAAGRLRAAELRTIGDLARAEPARLEQLLGSWGRHVHELARGVDDRDVVVGIAPKSIGAEQTFEQDLTTRAAIEHTLLDHARRVAHRLVRDGWLAGTVVVKIKYADFSLRSRQARLPEPVADTTSIHRAACALLERLPLGGKRVRLTGVAAADLCREAPRLLFPDESAARRRKLERVVLEVEDRFGRDGLTRADLLEPRPRGVGGEAANRRRRPERDRREPRRA